MLGPIDPVITVGFVKGEHLQVALQPRDGMTGVDMADAVALAIVAIAVRAINNGEVKDAASGRVATPTDVDTLVAHLLHIAAASARNHIDGWLAGDISYAGIEPASSE